MEAFLVPVGEAFGCRYGAVKPVEFLQYPHLPAGAFRKACGCGMFLFEVVGVGELMGW